MFAFISLFKAITKAASCIKTVFVQTAFIQLAANLKVFMFVILAFNFHI
jgi:hypothetical protein